MQLKKILTIGLVVHGVVMYAQINPVTHAVSYAKPAFEVNKGQIKDSELQPAPYVKYALQHGNTRLFMLPTGIAYQFEQTHYPTNYPINNQTPEDVEQMQHNLPS